MNYNRLIENPSFFKWIFHSSPEINAYWNQFLENNPSYRMQYIELLSQIEKYLKLAYKRLTESELQKLISNRLPRSWKGFKIYRSNMLERLTGLQIMEINERLFVIR